MKSHIGSGMAVDDSGFGAGAWTTFVEPWLGSDGDETELDDECEDDDSESMFPKLSKRSFHSFSNSSSLPRLPNTVITSLGMCTTSTRS